MNRKKIIYSILKEIEKGNEPKREIFDLKLEEWGEIAEIIRDEGLLEGVIVQRAGIGSKVIYAWFSDARITMKGINFLEENNGLSKGYKVAKEIRDWIKW